MQYKNPAPTVNIIIINNKKICLVQRTIPPFNDTPALPGGYVDYEETVENAAIREAKEETGLDITLQEILGVYSNPDRNPSKHTISTVFIATTQNNQLTPSKEGHPFWINIQELKKTKLAFDHNKIIDDFTSWQTKKDTYWSNKTI